jgi:hypothetical protein
MDQNLMNKFLRWYGSQRPTYSDSPKPPGGMPGPLTNQFDKLKSPYWGPNIPQSDYYNLDALWKRKQQLPLHILEQLYRNEMDKSLSANRWNMQDVPYRQNKQDQRTLVPRGDWNYASETGNPKLDDIERQLREIEGGRRM